jgi:hypothetical protein
MPTLNHLTYKPGPQENNTTAGQQEGFFTLALALQVAYCQPTLPLLGSHEKEFSPFQSMGNDWGGKKKHLPSTLHPSQDSVGIF